MKNTLLYLLLLVFWGFSRPALAQNTSISGETTITPGQSYRYTFGGTSCNKPTYYYSVNGGVITTDNQSGGIVVRWDDPTTSPSITVYVYGIEYDAFGDDYNIYCGSSTLSNFTVKPRAVGTAQMLNNTSPNNEVCPYQPFTLGYLNSSGIQTVIWYNLEPDGTWTWVGSAFDSDPTFAVTLQTASDPAVYLAYPLDYNGVAQPTSTVTVHLRDISKAGGIVLGSRDVLFGSNQGKVVFAEGTDNSIQNWQRSEDNSDYSWIDLPENGEELEYTDLTTTTRFRVKSYLNSCGVSVYSEPCTIRVGEGEPSWVENKTFDENQRVVGNSRSYFDLAGKLLQSQTLNLSQGKILATQPLTSQYDQPVGTTLPAPINDTHFTYNSNFLSPATDAGSPYTYGFFDSSSTLNNPTAVANSKPGTLGWYYSTNNTLEPNVAATGYPYSRTAEAPDGSTGVVRSSGVGEVFRMGQGKENVQGTFAVRSELDTYLTLRNRYFPTALVGEQIASLSAAATQQVVSNGNKQKTISFQDKEGHTVMTARPSNQNPWVSSTNTVEIGWPYCIVKDYDQVYQTPVIEAFSDIMVYDAGYNLVYKGRAQEFNINYEPELYRIYCREPFRILTGPIISSINGQPISSKSENVFNSTKRDAFDYYNFHTLADGNATITDAISGSDYAVVNTETGTDVTTLFKNNASAPAGFYQIRIKVGAVNLSYRNDYQDISYNFYNQKGQLLGSLAPNGAERVLDDLKATNLATYPTTTTLPFYTSYEYNVKGQLLARNEADAGRTEYYYRTDGTIRFSQNAKQRPLGYFSYTNYDDSSRPVEAGECRPANAGYFATIATAAAILESTDPRGGFDLNQLRKDVVMTDYDLPVALPPLAGSYKQEFLAGRVASTRKYHTLTGQSTDDPAVTQTWFSYDEQGRSKWVIRQLFGQSPHTLDYDYDFSGNVQSVCYQKDVPSVRFTHYYSYDADQRLSEVRTNNAAPTDQAIPRQLQASYSYYLHGPLKRVVIGGLQGVDYLYTAQGWLKSINGLQQGSDPAGDAPATTGQLADLFSQELEYYSGDYYSGQRPGGNFSTTGNHAERFDGTVRALAWRTPSHPTLQGYGYRYDERGQLSQADYGQPTIGTGASVSFTTDPLGRYAESNLSYDPNGNLQSLRRTDRSGAHLMNINYDYLGATNKLQRVRNPLVPNALLIDYSYDALGQLTAQLEPGVEKYFDYDVSGKVTDVYRNAGKTDRLAQYVYDEFGQRIRQTVYKTSGAIDITDYIRDAVGTEMASYYSDATGSHLAEQPIYGASRLGVVRQPRDQEPGAALYELNDQLGNTRVVFQAPRTDTYLLTMENGRTDEEQKQFSTPNATTYNAVRQSDYARQNSPNLATIAPYTPHYAIRLSSQVGPGKKLAIAPGDQVRLEVWAAYSGTPGGVINGRVAKPVTLGLLGGATLLTQPQPRLAETPGTRPSSAWQRLLSQVSVGVAIPLGVRSSKAVAYDTPTPLTAPPNAVLRYTLRLVRDRSLVDQGTAQVPAAAEGQWQPLNLTVNANIEEPAELEVWVQNLDAQDVYFDDLRIEHQVGPVVQENHFYAYGQRNEGLSWTRQYLRGYGRGYQGQHTRFDEETGYDSFELRNYDARIGRWMSMDPMGQYHSPYVGMGNDPMNGIDPDGGWLFGWFGSTSAERQTDRALNLANNAPNAYFISEKNYVSTQNINNLLGVGWSDENGAYSRQNFKDPFSGSLDRSVAMYNGTWDPISDQRIAKLDPRVQEAATNFINSVQETYGIKLRVDQGLRTIAEQNVLYAQGRTSPGNIVTKVKGGFSAHNYGLAIDVVPTVNGQVKWVGAEPILQKVSHLGKESGFEWGGDWNPHHKKGGFVDLPHFQMHWSNKHSKPL